MDTPGLFPDEADRPVSWAKPVAVLLAALLVVGGAAAAYRISRLQDRLDQTQAREPSVPEAVIAPPAEDLRPLVAELEARLRERPVAAPPPAPPAWKPEEDEGETARLRKGMALFRNGDYEEAELQFFQAAPHSWLHLALASLVRGDLRQALLFLARAMEEDREWLKTFLPQEMFGSSEDFQEMLETVEGRVGKDPLDADARVLLAYLYYYKKGPPYAQALLLEATNVAPGHPEATRFLESLEGR